MLYYPVCQKYITGMKSWAEHVGSTRHSAVAATKRMSPEVQPEEADYIAGHTLCATCNVHIPDRYWPRHHLTPRHTARGQFIIFRTVLDEAEKDKNGITVSGDFDFGVVDGPAAKSGVLRRSTIKNTTPSSQVSLLSITLASQKGRKTQSP
jgi:helicase MOV-10